MNFKKKLLTLFMLSLFIMPLNAYAYSDHIIIGGQNVGIEISSKHVAIVGFYKVGDSYIGKDAGLKIGDMILEVEDQEVASITEMIYIINKNVKNNSVNLTILRGTEEKRVKLNLVKDANDVYKTGIYVKDQITGIGTLTYIDPETKIFGALGHEIIDSSTSQKVEIKGGKIFKSTITGTTKSTDTTTGEKNAIFYSNDVYGSIKENTTSGIFGTYDANYNSASLVKVGNKEDITLGKAEILTVVNGTEVEAFEIEIIKINEDSSTKNILFEITDQRLIEITNGVVKGMSGSPIMQNDKIIGAVTHAIVNDSNKGYGIFITTMLEEGEN